MLISDVFHYHCFLRKAWRVISMGAIKLEHWCLCLSQSKGSRWTKFPIFSFPPLFPTISELVHARFIAERSIGIVKQQLHLMCGVVDTVARTSGKGNRASTSLTIAKAKRQERTESQTSRISLNFQTYLWLSVPLIVVERKKSLFHRR